MKGKHCLVYWLRTKQITVLLTKDIPAKKRKEDVPIKLLWKDEETNKTTSWDAKILRFDDDPDFLNRLVVNEDDGTIIGSDKEASRKETGQKRIQLQGDAGEQKKQRTDVFTYKPPQELSQQPSVSHTPPLIPESSEPGTSRVIISSHEDKNDEGEPSTLEKERPSEKKIEEVPSISPILPAETQEIKPPEDQLDQENHEFKPEDSEDSGDSEDSEDSEDSDEEAQSPNHHHQCPVFPGMGPPTREIVGFFKAITQGLELWLQQEESKAREKDDIPTDDYDQDD